MLSAQRYPYDGSVPKNSHGYLPIDDPEFPMHTGPIPIPLELAKQWDLRTLSLSLSKYLPPPITQEEIDEWYPEPTAQIGDLEDNDSDASTSSSD